MMQAIGYNRQGELNRPDSLSLFETKPPELGEHDLLVKVKAVGVNPVDVKVRSLFPPEDGPKITGYDVAGIVVETGSKVSLFQPGDEVYYAGDLQRPGASAEFHAVHEALVGKKPKKLSFNQAAALPLTTLTAWELLFDSFRIRKEETKGESILILGAAGGVGSIMIQLVRQLTHLKIIASASRRDSAKWVKKLGADYVINHHEPIAPQVQALGEKPLYVASLMGTEENFVDIVDTLPAFGHFGLIDDPKDPPFHYIKQKSLSLHWEFMFARSMHRADDMDKQHQILNRAADLFDKGILKPTLTQKLGTLTADSLHLAHLRQQQGRMIGKQVFDVKF